jgi:hypothetical protein
LGIYFILIKKPFQCLQRTLIPVTATKVHPKVFSGGLAGVADPEAIYDLCFILKTMLLKSSKSPNQHLVRLQVKLQLAEKVYIFVGFQWLILAVA